MAKKILVVDDEPDIQKSVKMLVETMGFEAKTTDDGNEAIKMLKNDSFDLVVLDMLMPKISGINTLKKIRGDPKIKNQKVIFLTVVGLNQSGKGVVKKLNPAGYIEKPIENDSFKAKIKKIVD